MHKIEIAPNAPEFIQRAAVEASAVLGFRSVALEFPILSFKEKDRKSSDSMYLEWDSSLEKPFEITIVEHSLLVRIRDRDSVLPALSELSSKLLVEEYGPHAIIKNAPPKPFKKPGAIESGLTPFPEHRGLESIFSKDFLLKDRDFDFLPDMINALIVLRKDFDNHELTAACDLACRLGMESLGLDLPILHTSDEYADNSSDKRAHKIKHVIAIVPSAVCEINIRTSHEGKTTIEIKGSGHELVRMVSALCQGPDLSQNGFMNVWEELCEDLRMAAAMKNLDGQIAWLSTLLSGIEKIRKNDGTAASRALPPAIEAMFDIPEETEIDELKTLFPTVHFRNRRSLERLCEGEFFFPAEIDVCRKTLDGLYGLVRKDDDVDLIMVVGASRPVREELAGEIKNNLETRNPSRIKVHVIESFKQGFSWIRDDVLKDLKSINGIAKIRIGFSSFLSDGRAVWNDEDGTIPRINANREPKPDAWMDSPIRLLQELYPIDDILAMELNLKRECIEFQLLSDASETCYRLEAFNQTGMKVFDADYSFSFSERPYIDEFPMIGKVHPGTGRILLKVNGKKRADITFRTDIENAWNCYQTEVLPMLGKLVREKHEQNGASVPAAELQPYFARLDIEIGVNGSDEALHIRNERISSLESLHEDIYFVGLDYFQTLGLALGGKGIDAPGLIVPHIHKTRGKPFLRFSLTRQVSAVPAMIYENKMIQAPIAGHDVDVYVEKCTWDSEHNSLVPHVLARIGNGKGASPVAGFNSIGEAFSVFLDNWAKRKKYGCLQFILHDAYEDHHVRKIGSSSKVDIEDSEMNKLDFLEEAAKKLITYREYRQIIEKLKKIPQIRVVRTAQSLLGRDIYAIEMLPHLKGYVSRTKLIDNRPVCLINARHHANEVSSTNSSLQLIAQLLRRKDFFDVPDKMNIVIVPMENVDGVEIHNELAAEHPEWMLHTARYNSLGKEIALEYFNNSTIHTEAMAFTRIWRTWLPDAVVDDHGVPTHEWCQQFSGYNPPWFKGFWMPRALLYGYFWYVNEKKYKANKALDEAIISLLAENIAEDPEISLLNAEWRERYEKYAHRWMPKLFPAEYCSDLIVYWIGFPYMPNYHYAAVRFPWITATSFVSEVADETAKGAYLELCARVHLLNDWAAITSIKNSANKRKEHIWIENGSLSMFSTRIRPPKLRKRIKQH
jgi:hypothetical protein